VEKLIDKREQLARLVNARAEDEGVTNTIWPELSLAKITQPQAKQPMHYKPALCFVVQGQKQVFLGDKKYTYDPFNYLVVPMSLPLEMEISQATTEQPLLGLALELDLNLLSELLASINKPSNAEPLKQPALFVSSISENIQDALIRLLQLLSEPEDLKVLGKSIVREIIYWVLQGEQGEQLRQLLLRDSSSYRVINTINYLNQNYSQQISIDELSEMSNMSGSALHQKFKQVTLMSPLQYLKKIRLHNARTLMLERGLNASDAGFKVGYTNPSQFSREFKRLFGMPPMALRNLSV